MHVLASANAILNKNPNNNPSCDTHNNSGVQVARRAVQSLLEQIQHNDAPAVNDQSTITSPPTSPSTLLTTPSGSHEEEDDNDSKMNVSMIYGKLSHQALAALCRAALQENTSAQPPPRYHEKEEKKQDDCEHSIQRRLQLFGSEYARHLSHCELRPTGLPKPTRKSPLSKHHHVSSSILLENAPYDYQVGAILDILCMEKKKHESPPPKGYFRISSATNNTPYHFHVKKEPNWDKAAQRPCLTALVVSSTCPPGFSVVRVGRHGPPAVFYSTHEAPKLYLCFRRSREGNPLTGLQLITPPAAIPSGYTLLERTPQGQTARLYHFIAVRQRLAHLESLSIPSPGPAYYATGGVWISARTGKFHVLDRSTHALKSPSAIAHRLSILERTTSWTTTTTSSYSKCSMSDSGDSEAQEDLLEDLFIPRVPPQDGLSLLLPLLTACYIRHGGAAWVALNELTRLLKTTPFFANSSTALSALDIATQAVCDVATNSADPTTFVVCIEFVSHAMRFATLQPRTLGFCIRFLFFCFHAETTTTLPQQDEDVLFLLHDNETPQGAAQAAAASLKDLITLCIQRVRTATPSPTTETPTPTDYTHFMDDIVTPAVDQAVDHVEKAQWMQLVLHQIKKSGGSELFWHEMVHECGSALFGSSSPEHVIVFAILQSIVKVCSAPLRYQQHTAILSKDMASKLLSMELLLHFVETWGDEQDGKELDCASQAMAYAVRRSVVPCALLANTQASMESAPVFRRLVRIVSELWLSPVYRHSCKIELGLLLDHFAVGFLEIGPQCWTTTTGDNNNTVMLLSQQLSLIGEIESWFSQDPKDALEMFLNYDTDIEQATSPGFHSMPPGARWQVFQRLVLGLSSTAESCGELICQQIQENQSIILDPTQNEGRKDVDQKARVREAARLLRKASLQTLSQIIKCVAISASSTAGIEFASLLISWCPDTESAMLHMGVLPVTTKCNEPQQHTRSAEEEEVLKFWETAEASTPDLKQVTTCDIKAKPSSQDSLRVAFEISKTKSLKKAVEFLIACHVLAPSPRDIANFLQIHKGQFDRSAIGIYLSESGNGGMDNDFWTTMRHHFIRSSSFIGMSVEAGFRRFVTNAGFCLPGEAQRMDRILSSFARCYFEDNAGDTVHCPFQDEDSVYLLVFAIVMLNTDLHKNVSSRKQSKKMSKAEFLNNLKGAIQHDVFPREYLSLTYDAIASKPIEFLEEEKADVTSRGGVQILNNVRQADSILRGVAVHDFKFTTIDSLSGGDLTDLARDCVAKIWHNLHGVVNTALECAHLDPEGLEPAIDILLYGLVVTVCLEMPLERSAFLAQFVRLRLFGEKMRGRVGSDMSMRAQQLQWFEELEELCTGPTEQKIEVLRRIRPWVHNLRATLRVDLCNKTEMNKVVSDLRNGDFLLNDPARSFLQSGNLIKKSNRTGRCVEYRFFLFSDVLLYASKEAEGRFKIHEELPLHLMKVVDWFPLNKRGRQVMFQVHHPRKTFVVLCPTPESRRSWVEDIRAAIMVEMERKMVVEAARVATH